MDLGKAIKADKIQANIKNPDELLGINLSKSHPSNTGIHKIPHPHLG